MPRGISAGGRGTGSEKMVPIPCARAGDASGMARHSAMAAIGAENPARAMGRSISRGFKQANRVCGSRYRVQVLTAARGRRG